MRGSVVCESELCVSKLCVSKSCVGESCVGVSCVWVSGMWVSCVWVSCMWVSCVCVSKLCVGKWCGRRQREEEEAEDSDGSTEPKTRTPHKDVGMTVVICCVWTWDIAPRMIQNDCLSEENYDKPVDLGYPVAISGTVSRLEVSTIYTAHVRAYVRGHSQSMANLWYSTSILRS